jgi:hypothetical protein
MAETPEDPWAVSPDTDEQANVSPEQAWAAAEGLAGDVTQALANVAGELGGAAQVVLDAASKVHEHDVFHDIGEFDARSGTPDRHFGSGIPKDDVQAYEEGRRDAWGLHLDPNAVPTTPQTSMGPITKDEERRAIEHTKEWEDIKSRLGEGPDVHLDPNVPREPIPEGSPPPPIFLPD